MSPLSTRIALLGAIAYGVLGGAAQLQAAAPQSSTGVSIPETGSKDINARCGGIADRMHGRWPDGTTRILSAALQPAGTEATVSMGSGVPGPAIKLPEHCEVSGVIHERAGDDGQHYAIHFHVRLPTQWNRRFFFQGGGGTDGDVGDALGHISFSAPVALVQGFVVVSQDAGHDNSTNSNPARGGMAAFGFDAVARRDYGHSSLPAVSAAAKALIRGYYGEAPQRSYFVGCSKGGQEGMVFAQQAPEEFDGIVAADPGISMPRAALAQLWDVRSFSALAPQPAASPGPAFMTLATAFSEKDLLLVREAVLAACDADDGLKDGIVAAFAECTDRKVAPELQKRTCPSGKAEGCLSAAQVAALQRSLQGPRDQHGENLYTDWPWDAGIGSDAWRLWKLGQPGGMPALNLLLGGPATAVIFTTPPSSIGPDPQSAFDYALRFNFERDAQRIYATNPHFTTSAWNDISARSPDLAAFRAHGGKLIVPHGVSDPVFSINDTLAWYHEVDARAGGTAQQFLRVFPVPGMAHCAGGPATDSFDAFAALRGWVEDGKAPERIEARAGPATPWPGRSRPLCAYPAIARYSGHGDPERAEPFECRP
jgi:hypothetical protein